MAKILAIDPSTTQLGLYNGELHATLAASAKSPRPERFSYIAARLSDFLQDTGPYDFIVYEEQFVRGGAATKALYGIVGIIECLAITSGAGVMSLPQGTLRKWAKQEGPDGLKGKELYQRVAIQFDERLAVDPSVSEHAFDAACIYYFIQHKGQINA